MTKSKGTRSGVLHIGHDDAIVTRERKRGRSEKRRSMTPVLFTLVVPSLSPSSPPIVHRVFFPRRFRMEITLRTIAAQNCKLSSMSLNPARRPSLLIVTLSLNERKLDTCSREEAKKFFGFVLLIVDLLFGTGWCIRDLWKQDRFNETISLREVSRKWIVKTNDSEIDRRRYWRNARITNESREF